MSEEDKVISLPAIVGEAHRNIYRPGEGIRPHHSLDFHKLVPAGKLKIRDPFPDAVPVGNQILLRFIGPVDSGRIEEYRPASF
jgi:hypothetical protein